MSALIAALVVAAASAASQPPAPSGAASGAQQQGQASQTNTEAAHDKSNAATSVVVNVGAAQANQSHTGGKGQGEEHGAAAEWWVAGATVALAIVTAILALFTFGLWSATLKLSKDARTTGEDHAEKMERAITESNRLADATEKMLAAGSINAAKAQDIMRKQMRAYLTVEIGDGIYQDATKRFEVMPSCSNSGHTPAHKL